ncbi:hypothetical protein GCM10009017_01270 [Halarchaeum rubridurum]|uniref:Uncharacterized protein n=2 Tax=Halarchaeum rubridurum TaxID=489911 RepID=A0A830FNE4_9EURY|nr:hypothetical protein GCM10009017_01270 [Halarchaeum rubridurum]
MAGLGRRDVVLDLQYLRAAGFVVTDSAHTAPIVRPANKCGRCVAGPMPDPVCPDCDVEMAETNDDTTGTNDRIHLRGEGLRGALGVGRRDVVAYVCPACSLVRFYAA